MNLTPPAAMFSLGETFGDLLFDDAGISTFPAGRIEVFLEPAEGCDEGDPVWVASGVHCSVGHEGSDGVMAAPVPPDFLQDQVGGLGPQHSTLPALVGFQIIERALNLPPL
jgi:hypothetical protein